MDYQKIARARCSDHNRAAKYRGIKGKLASYQVERLLREGCIQCGGFDTLTIHHKKARNKGGLNIIDNVVVLCERCHKEVHRQERAGRQTSFPLHQIDLFHGMEHLFGSG